MVIDAAASALEALDLGNFVAAAFVTGGRRR
jgi:hypothetical protein